MFVVFGREGYKGDGMTKAQGQSVGLTRGFKAALSFLMVPPKEFTDRLVDLL